MKIIEFFFRWFIEENSEWPKNSLSFSLNLVDTETCNVVHAIETRVFLFLEAAPGIINFRATLISRGEGKERGRREGGEGQRQSLVALVTRWHKTQPGCSSLGRHRTFTRFYIASVAPTSEIRRTNEPSWKRRAAVFLPFGRNDRNALSCRTTHPVAYPSARWSSATWWSRSGCRRRRARLGRANDIFLKEEARVSFRNCVKNVFSPREINTLSSLKRILKRISKL